jgi:Ca2+-binding EF-hand superfamily protein
MSNPSLRVECRPPTGAPHALAMVATLFAVLGFANLAMAQPAPTSPRAYLQRMDANGDGRVDEGEYLDYMNRGFAGMDRDGNGVLEGDELPPGARPITLDERRQALRAAFRRQDRNHDGFLDAAELARPPPAR